MISTHVLDTSRGLPAAGVSVSLEKKSGATWNLIDSVETNTDGRIAFNCPPSAGTYRLSFEFEVYFKRSGTEYFFITAPVIFQISDVSRKYHIPLLLNPFGYSTYRGS
jgi:5-hydroxyisourate hydrolase